MHKHGQLTARLMALRPLHTTPIGERHWPISIFLMQLAKGGNVLIDAERDPKRAIFKKPEQSILSSGEPGEQMHRFRQNRFTHQQRRLEFIDLVDDPVVISLCAVEERDQGPGINDGATHCRRKS